MRIVTAIGMVLFAMVLDCVIWAMEKLGIDL